MSSTDTVKLKLNMSVHYAIGTDYDEVLDTNKTCSEWDAMTPQERTKVCDEIYEEWVWEQIDGGYDVVRP